MSHWETRTCWIGIAILVTPRVDGGGRLVCVFQFAMYRGNEGAAPLWRISPVPRVKLIKEKDRVGK